MFFPGTDVLCPHPSRKCPGDTAGLCDWLYGSFLHIPPSCQTGWNRPGNRINTAPLLGVYDTLSIKLPQDSAASLFTSCAAKPRGIQCPQPPHCLLHLGPITIISPPALKPSAYRVKSTQPSLVFEVFSKLDQTSHLPLLPTHILMA